MTVKAGINFHNRFDIEIRDIETGELKQQGFAENIILEQMYSRICNFLTYFVNIHFGTGTGTLDPTRTSLFSYLGTKAATTEEIVKAYPTSKWVRKIILNPEEYVGTTFTEVGVAYGSTSSNLVTHAMIKDSEGNPLTLTKTDLDVMVIYATVFIELKNKDENFYFNRLPGNNTLLNYLTGSNMGTPVFEFGSIRANTPGNINMGIATKAPSKTIDLPNKNIIYSTRLGISESNGEIKEMTLKDIFRCSLPEVGLWESSHITDKLIGTGDGVTASFPIPNTDMYNATIRIDGALINQVLYTLDNLNGSVKIPISSILDLSETANSNIYEAPFNGMSYIGSSYSIVVKVDPEKVLNKTFRIYFNHSSGSAYSKTLNFYGSYDNATYTNLATLSASASIKTQEITITAPYKYLKVTANASSSSWEFNIGYFYIVNTDTPSINFTTPPGLVTAEAVGTGDASSTIFSLAHTPITGSLTIYIDGTATTDYTLDSRNITFTTAPGLNAVITGDYRYSCTITADYDVPYIPKDENHVLDVTMELQFGEGV